MTPSSRRVVLPGGTIGVLGGGQLGRMLAIAARRLGYRVHTFAPEGDTPAGQVADLAINARYDDIAAVRAFAEGVDVVTFEFENVSTAAAETAAAHTLVRPDGHALFVAQHRIREKTFLAARGLPVTPFAPVRSEGELAVAVDQIGCPSVLKTAALGYDGKGQRRIATRADATAAWASLGRVEAVLEALIDLEREISVIGARGVDGVSSHFGPFDNTHANHILDVTTTPAALPAAVAQEAVAVTRSVLDALDYVGVLCVEFFVATDGRLMINELAPRTHNSGHLTIDASSTSQFEQQVRAVCGLPLGSAELLRPAAMANLLGDLWEHGEPDWSAALAIPEIKLHLYGKATPRPGRKMGHLTALAATPADARALVLRARDALTPRA